MQITNPPCGIVYAPEGDSLVPIYLPLQRVSAHADIVDVSAIVTLKQVFWEYSPSRNSVARYVFPVPSRAAVCGFKMRTEDRRVVKAICQEREEAKRQHDEAIRQGKMTGLVQHVTDDIFSVSLGALPGEQLITIQLTYVLDLMDADLIDHVRFQLPVYVGMRYGEVPEGVPTAQMAISQRVQISATIRMTGVIKSISSPSHPELIVLEVEHPANTRPVSYNHARYLQHDFVLIIYADGLDAPRCFAERHPSGTTALQLTMVPKFDLPALPAQEYIFLVDRSGSMSGSRIDTAKKALIMLLRALPAQGTRFNIFSFGNTCDSLWGESVPYGESSLITATHYVDEMNANYGGTEIASALSTVFKSRNLSVPTACFVLTDGEAYDTTATFSTVTNAVATSRAEAPLRTFTLGIGETTSTAMCEGIARVGRGLCLMAETSESIIAKCSKLVRASRRLILTNVAISWAAGLAPSQDQVGAETQPLRQAPSSVPPLYDGGRFVVFALSRDPSFIIPDNVVITAQITGQEQILTYQVPVQEFQRTSNVPDQVHIIHTLAARRTIQELADAPNAHPVSTKETIISLGVQYQLASEYTSFIAIDNSGKVIPYPEELPNPDVGYSRSSGRVCNFPTKGGPRLWTGRNKSVKIPRMSQMQQRQQVSVAVRPRPASFAASASTSHAVSPAPSSVQVGSIPALQQRMQMMSQMLASPSSQSVPNPPSMGRFWQSIGPSVDVDSDAPEGSLRARSQSDIDRDVEKLVRLQTFNGSFAPSEPFVQILGRTAVEEGNKLRLNKNVWATILAIAYLQKYLTGQNELLEGLVEKAKDFVSQMGGIDFAKLLGRASELLA